MQNPKNTANLPSPDDCRHAIHLLLREYGENTDLSPGTLADNIRSILNRMLKVYEPPSSAAYAKLLESDLIYLSSKCTHLAHFIEKALKYSSILKQSVDLAASHEPHKP